ncbi:tyrosine-type recombinase/integrase [Streptomyces triticirhizae]|uniref:Site-specific integrase n=1 Tax=Streptomyces triticirhizae TaxID=2483353 RepID=A0A3M2MAZ9_9ACTN|nr:site-specific integrase [Streptomyces triticirhizae]RMI46671.1 site-specific integrase [Streptomyces triticirhizae]
MATIIDKGASSPGRRWLVRYREPGGRSARQREKSFARRKDAADFATKVEHDKRSFTYADPHAGNKPLHVFVDEWLDALHHVTDGTWESYERIWRLHVLPHLGRRTLGQVSMTDVERLFATWSSGGAPRNTIESRRIAVSSAFTYAVRHKLVPLNPVRGAELPGRSVTAIDEHALPSMEEVQAIAESIGSRLEPAIWLMACCGLRIGEVLGLHETDFHGNTVRLRRQVTRTKARDGIYVVRYAPLKHRSEGEWRDVPLPESIAPFAQCFPILTEKGTIPYPDLLRRSWNRAIKRLGLPHYTPHDLRHLWATMTLTRNVSLHEVSRWLGHRSIKVTVDRYGHLTRDGHQRCREVVEALCAPFVGPALSGAPVA